LLVGLGVTPVIQSPANAAVAVVVGGKINGGIVVSRQRLCRRWNYRSGKRYKCRTWGWRHRVRHCNRWHWNKGRRGKCRGHRFVYVWR
jgi:hypothetical protein